MNETDYERVEFEKDGMKICLEFPKETNESGMIARDIQAILNSELREKLAKNA